MIRKIRIGLPVVLVMLQAIRPAHNTVAAISPTDITHAVAVPDTVLQLLQTAGYDCHSNHTGYPWHARLNPVGYWLARHVTAGKRR